MARMAWGGLVREDPPPPRPWEGEREREDPPSLFLRKLLPPPLFEGVVLVGLLVAWPLPASCCCEAEGGAPPPLLLPALKPSCCVLGAVGLSIACLA